MKLTAFVVDGHTLDIRPAPVERDWMNATNQRFAYRCLPLAIANAHGWEILCPQTTIAVWDGGEGMDAIRVEGENGLAPSAVSHFGHGILTFHVPAIFRTEPGWDLFVAGPVNAPKDAVGPLSGIVETDWAPFSFTMNWRFTRSGQRVRFEKGEPFCHIFPVRRGLLEEVRPEVRTLSSDPELERLHKQWSASRDAFNRDLKTPGTEAREARWQKSYHRGEDAQGQRLGADDHRTRLRLRPFSDEAE